VTFLFLLSNHSCFFIDVVALLVDWLDDFFLFELMFVFFDELFDSLAVFVPSDDQATCWPYRTVVSRLIHD
jgi:hypothetical protein